VNYGKIKVHCWHYSAIVSTHKKIILLMRLSLLLAVSIASEWACFLCKNLLAVWSSPAAAEQPALAWH